MNSRLFTFAFCHLFVAAALVGGCGSGSASDAAEGSTAGKSSTRHGGPSSGDSESEAGSVGVEDVPVGDAGALGSAAEGGSADETGVPGAPGSGGSAGGNDEEASGGKVAQVGGSSSGPGGSISTGGSPAVEVPGIGGKANAVGGSTSSGGNGGGGGTSAGKGGGTSTSTGGSTSTGSTGAAGNTGSAGSVSTGPTLFIPSSTTCSAGNVLAAYGVCTGCHYPGYGGIPSFVTYADNVAYNKTNPDEQYDRVVSGEMPLAGSFGPDSDCSPAGKKTSCKNVLLNWLKGGLVGVTSANGSCP